MNWNAYSPTPQFSNLLLYTFWIVPPILNLVIQGTLHIFKHTQPDHTTYDPLGHIFKVCQLTIGIKSPRCKKYGNQYPNRTDRREACDRHKNQHMHTNTSGNTCRSRVFPRPATLPQYNQIIPIPAHRITNMFVQHQANKSYSHSGGQANGSLVRLMFLSLKISI